MFKFTNHREDGTHSFVQRGLSYNNLVFIVMKIFTWKGKIKLIY